MKVWVWNFLPAEEEELIKKVIDEEIQKLSTIVEETSLVEKTWENCECCYKCWTGETNVCKHKDRGRELVDVIKQFDLLVCVAAVSGEGQLPDKVLSAFNRLLPNLIDRKFKHPNLLFCAVTQAANDDQNSSKLSKQNLRRKIERLGIDYRFSDAHVCLFIPEQTCADNTKDFLDVVELAVYAVKSKMGKKGQ